MNNEELLNRVIENVKIRCEITNMEKEEKILMNKRKKFIKTFALFIISIFLVTGIAYATSFIWKEPVKYNSFEELQAENKREEILSEEEKEEVISEDRIREKTKNILEKVTDTNNVNDTINLKRSYAASYDKYYEVKTSNDYFTGIEMNFNAENGALVYFVDRDLENKAIVGQAIDIGKLKEYLKKIENLFFDGEDYTFEKIEETPHMLNNTERKEWNATYYKKYDGIINEYEKVVFTGYYNKDSFYLYQYASYDEGYYFEKNEIKLTKEQAMDIGKKQDKKITDLEIKEINAELGIKPMNSFVYVQENSNGIEDGLVEETQKDGTKIIYNQYQSEKKLRMVWKITIKYDINYSDGSVGKLRNSKEIDGREYYIDATTGEVIGGNWN